MMSKEEIRQYLGNCCWEPPKYQCKKCGIEWEGEVTLVENFIGIRRASHFPEVWEQLNFCEECWNEEKYKQYSLENPIKYPWIGKLSFISISSIIDIYIYFKYFNPLFLPCFNTKTAFGFWIASFIFLISAFIFIIKEKITPADPAVELNYPADMIPALNFEEDVVLTSFSVIIFFLFLGWTYNNICYIVACIIFFLLLFFEISFTPYEEENETTFEKQN